MNCFAVFTQPRPIAVVATESLSCVSYLGADMGVERYDREWFPPAVARFVAAVESGQVLRSTEFAQAVSATDSDLFRDAGQVRFDSGADAKPVLLLFHCKSAHTEQGIVAFLTLEGDAVRHVQTIVKEITPSGL